MCSPWSPAAALLRDRRGIALPLALLGLVLVSLMVTTALLTSSTEVALSLAHRDGARGLYAADAALQGYLAQQAALVSPQNPSPLAEGAAPVAMPDGADYRVTVARLHRDSLVVTGPLATRAETYSLVAAPQNGRGRGVGALVQVTREALPASFNIDAGLTVGADLRVTGSATISDGRDGAACDSAAAPSAIRHAAGASVSYKPKNVVGAVADDSQHAGALMAQVLNGLSVDQVAQRAGIRFGRQFSRAAFDGSKQPSQTNREADYRWGCPAALVTGCGPRQARYFPVIAIDADGGEVHIRGEHGQGTLLILNGDLQLNGNFQFQGIVIVEGTTRITGTPRIEGAMITMGDETVIDPSAEALSSGNSVIRYNRCEILNAQRGLTEQGMDLVPQQFTTPTFGWFEVVR